MSTYDAELPILAELEAALHARAVALATTAAPSPAGPAITAPAVAPGAAPPAAPATGAAPPAAPAPATGAAPPAAPAAATGAAPPAAEAARRSRAEAARRPRPRRARAARVARRALVLVGVSGLVGASAFATRSLVGAGGGDGGRAGDPSLRTTTAVELGAGGRAEGWTLSAARRGSDLCDALIAGGAVATRCERPPGTGGILLDGLVSPRARYVVGLVGPRVTSVAVAAGDGRRVVRTRPAHDPAAARGARLPRGLRWFVVTLPRDAPTTPSARRARVTVTGRGRGGRALTRRSLVVRRSLVNKQ